MQSFEVLNKTGIWEITRAIDLIPFRVNSYLSCYWSLINISKQISILEIIQTTCFAIIHVGNAIHSFGSQWLAASTVLLRLSFSHKQAYTNFE